MAQAKNKKPKKTKISFLPPHDISAEDKDIQDMLIFEEEDLQILYNALSKYKPTEKEEQRYELLLEEFDELVNGLDDNGMTVDLN